GAELQTEYFVSREHAMAAFDAIDALRAEIHPLIQVTEVRTIAADNLWMSMNYERSSVAFHFTWKPEWERVRMVLPKIEAALQPFAPRAHWGKLFTLPGEVVRACYPRAGDFADLARSFDPTGKFANAFLRSTVLSA
ncbi:MAG: D-arabinono-1,4-lactone oxidase, partial [Tepidisphaeraceae bacterium]